MRRKNLLRLKENITIADNFYRNGLKQMIFELLYFRALHNKRIKERTRNIKEFLLKIYLIEKFKNCIREISDSRNNLLDSLNLEDFLQIQIVQPNIFILIKKHIETKKENLKLLILKLKTLKIFSELKMNLDQKVDKLNELSYSVKRIVET